MAVTSTAIREHNVATVLDVLRARRPVSRTDLAGRTGLSNPTVGSVLRALEARGLVREFGRTTGRRGRSATLYDLVPEAVLVLGLDIGARHIRGVVADLDGQPVDDHAFGLAEPRAAEVLTRVRELRERVSPVANRLEIAVVGSPGVVDPATRRIGSAPNIAGWEGLAVEAVLADALGGVPVRVENDVNLAALGEQARGAGAGVDSFAYLNIGSGLGAGIVLHGQLHRGARGAAGEVGFLPVAADAAGQSAVAEGGAMEARLSRRGLVAAAEELATTTPTSLSPPFDAQALLDAARRGDVLARAVLARAAQETAVCVAALTAVADLELVLLGGGIGESDELLLPDVRAAVTRLVPAPPRIERATLGDRAIVTGAVAVALDVARRTVVAQLATRGV